MKEILEKLKAESKRMRLDAQEGNVPNNEAWYHWRVSYLQGFDDAITTLENWLVIPERKTYKVDCQCSECDDYTIFNLSEEELKRAYLGDYENNCKHCKSNGVDFYPVYLIHSDGSRSRADDLAETLIEKTPH